MARPVWAGVLSFGLVSVPVQMFTATESHTIHFHQLQRGTSDRVRNKRVNERTGKEVPLDDVVKGYDTGDEYVLVEPGELEDIAPGRSKALDITGFVDLDEVEPVYFDRTYYLGPRSEDYAKIYSLLTRALEKANRAGIATFVMRQRAYLVAVKAEDGLLTLHTLHWADEIRDPRGEISTLPKKAKGSGKELRMAERLVEELSMEWDPTDYHDTFQEKVAALLDAKQSGRTVEKAEPPADSTNVVDLMDALRSSVEQARGPKNRRRPGTRRKKTGTRGSRSGSGQKVREKDRGESRAKGSGGPARGRSRSELEELTKAELTERARAEGLSGRSRMTRDELVTALAGGPGRSTGRAA